MFRQFLRSVSGNPEIRTCLDTPQATKMMLGLDQHTFLWRRYWDKLFERCDLKYDSTYVEQAPGCLGFHWMCGTWSVTKVHCHISFRVDSDITPRLEATKPYPMTTFHNTTISIQANVHRASHMCAYPLCTPWQDSYQYSRGHWHSVMGGYLDHILLWCNYQSKTRFEWKLIHLWHIGRLVSSSHSAHTPHTKWIDN